MAPLIKNLTRPNRPKSRLDQHLHLMGISNLFDLPAESGTTFKLLIGEVQAGKTNAMLHAMLKYTLKKFSCFVFVVRDAIGDANQLQDRLESFLTTNNIRDDFQVYYLGDCVNDISPTRTKNTVIIVLYHASQLKFLKSTLEEFSKVQNRKFAMFVDESDFHVQEDNNTKLSKSANILRACFKSMDLVVHVTATAYTHLVHNKVLKVRDVAVLNSGTGYVGIHNLMIIDKDFPKRIKNHASEHPVVAETISDILQGESSARLLVNGYQSNLSLENSVRQAIVRTREVYLSYHAGSKNLLKCEGIDITLSSLEEIGIKITDTETKRKKNDNGYTLFTWTNRGATIADICKALVKVGAKKIIIFAGKLADRGITFTGLTHQILIASDSTAIVNLWQRLRILGYPEDGKEKKLYVHPEIHTELSKLVSLNMGIKALLMDSDTDSNTSTCDLLSEFGVPYYASVERDLVPVGKGKIDQIPIIREGQRRIALRSQK